MFGDWGALALVWTGGFLVGFAVANLICKESNMKLSRYVIIRQQRDPYTDIRFDHVSYFIEPGFYSTDDKMAREFSEFPQAANHCRLERRREPSNSGNFEVWVRYEYSK